MYILSHIKKLSVISQTSQYLDSGLGNSQIHKMYIEKHFSYFFRLARINHINDYKIKYFNDGYLCSIVSNFFYSARLTFFWIAIFD